MSRVDWDAMVAQLSEQRTAVAEELQDIDAVLETVRARAAGTPAVQSKPAPGPHKNGRAKAKPVAKPVAKPAAKASAQSGKLTPDQIVRMGELFEADHNVEDIAKRFKITAAGVYYYAKSRKWKRPNPGVAASPAAAAPAQPAGTQLSGSVKCTDPECGAWTDYDPCRTCGKKLKRKGW